MAKENLRELSSSRRWPEWKKIDGGRGGRGRLDPRVVEIPNSCSRTETKQMTSTETRGTAVRQGDGCGRAFYGGESMAALGSGGSGGEREGDEGERGQVGEWGGSPRRRGCPYPLVGDVAARGAAPGPVGTSWGGSVA